MTTPMNATLNNDPMPVATISDERITTDGNVYLPTDFAGDYHVEQDDETES